MPRVTWNKSRVKVYLGIFVLFLFFVIFNTRHLNLNHARSIVAEPKIVWEYVADFSNVKKLNPSILDFSVIGDSGTYDAWTYDVSYTERLSHWPYLFNIGHGHYDVRPINEKEQSYIIESRHKTCFFYGFVCYKTFSTMTFKPAFNGKETHCSELIQYECPFLFSSFCQAEVSYQRTAVMDNLHNHFQWIFSH